MSSKNKIDEADEKILKAATIVLSSSSIIAVFDEAFLNKEAPLLKE